MRCFWNRSPDFRQGQIGSGVLIYFLATQDLAHMGNMSEVSMTCFKEFLQDNNDTWELLRIIDSINYASNNWSKAMMRNIILINMFIGDNLSPSHLSFFSISLPDVLCDPTDLIWRKGTQFEAMTGRTVSSSEGLLAEIFRGFPQL